MKTENVTGQVVIAALLVILLGSIIYAVLRYVFHAGETTSLGLSAFTASLLVGVLLQYRRVSKKSS